MSNILEEYYRNSGETEFKFYGLNTKDERQLLEIVICKENEIYICTSTKDEGPYTFQQVLDLYKPVEVVPKVGRYEERNLEKFYNDTKLKNFMFEGCETDTDGHFKYFVTIHNDKIEIKENCRNPNSETFDTFDDVNKSYDVFEVFSIDEHTRRINEKKQQKENAFNRMMTDPNNLNYQFQLKRIEMLNIKY